MSFQALAVSMLPLNSDCFGADKRDEKAFLEISMGRNYHGQTQIAKVKSINAINAHHTIEPSVPFFNH